MARKSSKTSHVMNLLAGDTQVSDQESSITEAAKENMAAKLASDSPETIKELTVLAQQASIQTKEEPMKLSPISIIDVTSTVPDPVAELIKQELEEELSDNDPIVKPEQRYDMDSSSQHEPQSDESGFVPTKPVSDNNQNTLSSPLTGQADHSPEADTSELAALPSDAPVNDISSVEPEPVSVQKAEPAAEPLPDFNYLNVMEFVVKNMVEDYVKKFDVCSCRHCIADVTALTLTNLPPKYIVVQSAAASPLLNFYAARLAPQAIVELTKACSVVRENPHH